ncbi:MAG TPA: hypothetical protein VN373_04405 [Methanosarcina barkeri]|nr:hypothetical protein [Methanosarcina barkeri]
MYQYYAGKPGRLETYSTVFFPLFLILLQAGFRCHSPSNCTGVKSVLIAPSLLLSFVPEFGFSPEILILSMASLTFVISHVNNPFFWIFGELAELEPSEVFRSNTLGGALMGLVSFLLVSDAYFSSTEIFMPRIFSEIFQSLFF